jgi:hypothetical protein
MFIISWHGMVGYDATSQTSSGSDGVAESQFDVAGDWPFPEDREEHEAGDHAWALPGKDESDEWTFPEDLPFQETPRPGWTLPDDEPLTPRNEDDFLNTDFESLGLGTHGRN